MDEPTKEMQMMRFPRWLSWVVLIGLGWILYVGNTREPRPVPQPTTETAAPATTEPKPYTELDALLDGERWIKAINPDYQSPDEPCRAAAPKEGMLGNYAIVLDAGVGEGAKCGEAVDLTIIRRSNDGNAQEPIEATLTLGEQKGLDPVLATMRQSEKRLVIVNLPQKVKALPMLPANTQLLLEVTRR